MRIEKIREARLRQPIRELQRKMQKAGNTRSKLWTQEELYYADAVGRRLSKRLRRKDANVGDNFMFSDPVFW